MTLPSESPASGFATALLACFVRRGIRDLVICPGSRSQALALAAAELERAGLLRLRVRIDERSAGFLALGLAIETGIPVPVVMTSGTAVANLHPAVLEASHSGVPLIVISSDRPDELRGIGSNQTTVQPGMFGSAVRAEWDVPAPDADTNVVELANALVDDILDSAATDAAPDRRVGPVHLNLAFREPLSAAVASEPVSPGTWMPRRPESSPFRLEPRDGTVVIAGAGAGERAQEVARQLGAPLLAEVTSGARYGPNLVPAYQRLLRETEFGGAVRRAIVFGHPTLTREIPRLLQRDDVDTVIVRSPGREDVNPGRRALAIVDDVAVDRDAEPRDDDARAWLGRWVFRSRQLLAVDEAPAASLDDDYPTRARFARDQLERLRAPIGRRELAEALWASTWPHDRLVIAASRLIRDADAVVPGKRISAHANRGLAGIDGTISTAFGIALAAQEGRSARSGNPSSDEHGTMRVLLGDLALLHDAGSLLVPDGEPRPRMQLVVANDHGGTIFDSLEVAATANPGEFDRVMYTPQSVDLSALATAYGWEYRCVTGRGDLLPSLTANSGTVLIEVPLAR